jgi:hypothetical protein
MSKWLSQEGLVSDGDLTRGERLQVMLTPEELAAVDDFRFKNRLPSRAATIRELLRLGLASVGYEPSDGKMKSGEYGVLPRGPAPTDGQDSQT